MGNNHVLEEEFKLSQGTTQTFFSWGIIMSLRRNLSYFEKQLKHFFPREQSCPQGEGA
jgi:hypothetical protein